MDSGTCMSIYSIHFAVWTWTESLTYFDLYVLQSEGAEHSGSEGSKNRGGGKGTSAGAAGGSQRMAGICHLSPLCTRARTQQETATG